MAGCTKVYVQDGLLKCYNTLDAITSFPISHGHISIKLQFYELFSMVFISQTEVIISTQ